MIYLKIALGILALCLAWIVMYRSGLVLRFNAWMRERVFTDQHVLFSGQRVAVLLLILGAVALYSGLEQWSETPVVKPRIASAMLEQARNEFKARRYRGVVNRCKVLVRSNPKNLEAWELLAQSWWASGDKKKAGLAVQAILRLQPKHFLGRVIPTQESTKNKTH
ncbi:MAG: hypothetical protein LHV69_06810 [Elusimicrobia bacterium]|nr:hypothetical protein [Candidatus Obscuribacterium magneticum]